MEIKQALKSSWSIRPFFLCRQIQTETLGIRGRGATLLDLRDKIQEERGHLSWPRRLSRSPLTYRKTRANPGMFKNGFLTREGGGGVTTDKKERPQTEEHNGRKRPVPLKRTQSEADYGHPLMAEQSPPHSQDWVRMVFIFKVQEESRRGPACAKRGLSTNPVRLHARPLPVERRPGQDTGPPRPYLVRDDH